MLLEGKVLYVDMVDIKPPGIFLILAGFQAVFGPSVFVMRLLTSLWIALTAFVLYQCVKLLLKDEKAAIASGAIYSFFISTWSFYGISITPEVYFNLFTITAFYLLMRKQSVLNYTLAGLVAGLGFLVKYFVLFDFAAFLIFFAINEYSTGGIKGFVKLIFRSAAAGAGFLIPFLILNLVYYSGDHFNDFVNIVYLAPGRYPSPFNPWKMLKFILEFHLLFLPILVMFYYVLLQKLETDINRSSFKLLAGLWTILALFAVILAGKTFGHYTIQLMLPVSLAAGSFFMSRKNNKTWTAKFIKGKSGYIILSFLVVSICLMKLEYIIRKDTQKEIASYLEPRLKKNDIIYAGNYHHILYYLLGKDSPTKYIHRSLLISPKHIKALDIDVNEEFRKIMAARPAYILVEKEYPAQVMKDFIKENYVQDTVFEEKVFVYKLVEK